MHARAPFSPVLQGRESGEDGGWSEGSGGKRGRRWERTEDVGVAGLL